MAVLFGAIAALVAAYAIRVLLGALTRRRS
jgi:hypothetical protein